MSLAASLPASQENPLRCRQAQTRCRRTHAGAVAGLGSLPHCASSSWSNARHNGMPRSGPVWIVLRGEGTSSSLGWAAVTSRGHEPKNVPRGPRQVPPEACAPPQITQRAARSPPKKALSTSGSRSNKLSTPAARQSRCGLRPAVALALEDQLCILALAGAFPGASAKPVVALASAREMHLQGGLQLFGDHLVDGRGC